jgi:hypothetical protein
VSESVLLILTTGAVVVGLFAVVLGVLTVVCSILGWDRDEELK